MQIWLMYILFFRSKVLWPLLLVILLPMKLTTGCGFSSTAIFVNNSVPSELLASANGLAMTAAATCRQKMESSLVSGKNVTNDTKCRLKQGLTDYKLTNCHLINAITVTQKRMCLCLILIINYCKHCFELLQP